MQHPTTRVFDAIREAAGQQPTIIKETVRAESLSRIALIEAMDLLTPEQQEAVLERVQRECLEVAA